MRKVFAKFSCALRLATFCAIERPRKFECFESIGNPRVRQAIGGKRRRWLVCSGALQLCCASVRDELIPAFSLGRAVSHAVGARIDGLSGRAAR
jgi:hypothetical protein